MMKTGDWKNLEYMGFFLFFILMEEKRPHSSSTRKLFNHARWARWELSKNAPDDRPTRGLRDIPIWHPRLEVESERWKGRTGEGKKSRFPKKWVELVQKRNLEPKSVD